MANRYCCSRKFQLLAVSAPQLCQKVCDIFSLEENNRFLFGGIQGEITGHWLKKNQKNVNAWKLICVPKPGSESDRPNECGSGFENTVFNTRELWQAGKLCKLRNFLRLICQKILSSWGTMETFFKTIWRICSMIQVADFTLKKYELLHQRSSESVRQIKLGKKTQFRKVFLWSKETSVKLFNSNKLGGTVHF
jgi:hypothetical protein